MPPKAIALTAPAGGGVPPDLSRAALETFTVVPAHGGCEPGSPIDRIPFQFNPKELSIQKAAQWQRSTARKSKTAGTPEFKGSDPCKMTVEMFFDATEKMDGSVVARVEQLFHCLVPIDPKKDPSTPPIVVLTWGKVTSFPAFVTSVQAKYTLFTSDGTPIRATCNVTLEEMPGDPTKQNPTSGTLSISSVHTVVAGDSLASIAYHEYGDPAMWRPLAAFNGVDDPMRLRSGSSLLLPELADLLAGA